MNCANHPESPATAYCRSCGMPLCPACQRPANGTVYCAEHVPVASTPAGTTAVPNPGPQEWSPYTAPVAPPPPFRSDVSPGLAFVLGFIPGVGAIYNGQYVKAFVHVIVLGVLISILSSGTASGWEPLIGLLLAAWFFYMAFEAYHTARKRQTGEPVDEFSSLMPMRRRGFPAGPVVLIAFGLLFLLINFNVVTFDRIIRYWPVLLIAVGAYLLYERLSFSRDSGNPGYSTPFPGTAPNPEVQHDRH